MKLTHAIAVLKHAQTLESVGTLSSAMKQQVENYDKNIVALKAARKAVTLTARRMRELARIAEAVYAPGTFKDVSAPKKIPARRKQMVEKPATPAKQQSMASVTGYPPFHPTPRRTPQFRVRRGHIESTSLELRRGGCGCRPCYFGNRHGMSCSLLTGHGTWPRLEISAAAVVKTGAGVRSNG